MQGIEVDNFSLVCKQCKTTSALLPELERKERKSLNAAVPLDADNVERFFFQFYPQIPNWM